VDTFVHQSKYHNQVLHGYDMANLNPICTPMESRLKLNKEDCLETKKNKNKMSIYPYLLVVGNFMHAIFNN
jgi:hypothetical protein